MIVGMLAVLKAGSAYVPINPAYPAPQALTDALGGPLLLTTRELAGEFWIVRAGSFIWTMRISR
jgi:non-ribosomal peptide synthetase component F